MGTKTCGRGLGGGGCQKILNNLYSRWGVGLELSTCKKLDTRLLFVDFSRSVILQILRAGPNYSLSPPIDYWKIPDKTTHRSLIHTPPDTYPRFPTVYSLSLGYNVRKSYTPRQKLEIVEIAEKIGNRQAGRQEVAPESSIREWRKNKHILKAMKPTKRTLRYRKEFWPELEDELKKWVLTKRSVERKVSTIQIRFENSEITLSDLLNEVTIDSESDMSEDENTEDTEDIVLDIRDIRIEDIINNYKQNNGSLSEEIAKLDRHLKYTMVILSANLNQYMTGHYSRCYGQCYQSIDHVGIWTISELTIIYESAALGWMTYNAQYVTSTYLKRKFDEINATLAVGVSRDNKRLILGAIDEHHYYELWVSLNASLFLMIFIWFSSIPRAAHRQYPLLMSYLCRHRRQRNPHSLSLTERLKVMAFAERLSSKPTIGYYCYDMFPIDSYEFSQFILI
ncbi:unnamed protein product, partial [Medioppia subpectinata]